MESNFITNCNFYLFCFVLVVVEVAQQLRFIDEYGELETIGPRDQAEAFRETAEKTSGVEG